jgi:uncharacterized membrane protein YhaH (DUF805 family)
VSDTQAGPDWWLASDGKWYPPTSRPASTQPAIGPGPYDAPPAPDWWLASDGKWYPPSSRPGGWGAAPGTFGTRIETAWVSRALSGWVQGVFWATAVGAASLAVTSLRAYRVHDDHRAGDAPLSAWVEANDAQVLAFGLMALGVLALAVLFIVWSYKAHQASDRLGPIGRSWRRGWSIGGWFIPFANLVIPKLVLNETERITMAPRAGGVVTADWRRQPTSALGWVWWLTWVAGSVFMGLANIGEEADTLERTASQVRDTYAWSAMCGLALTISAVCAALFVRRVSRRLSPEALLTDDHTGQHTA